MKNIKRIVCTGGPCSGKTTFMTRVQEIFEERGYRVFIDHEAATDLITGGVSPATMGMYEFQKYVIGLQLKKEELFYQAAQNIKGDNVLIFIDRGILDDRGYVTPSEFETLLAEFGKTEEEVTNQYDLVLHLTTSAKGAEEAYTLSNNEARYEGIDAARAVDDTILDSWKDHPNRVIINNEADFEVKMRQAIQAVFTYLGQDKPVEVFKKYLVEVDDEMLEKVKEVSYNHTHIIQHFLKSASGTERRIRRREKDGSVLYYYAEANMLTANTRIKKDRIISERQYQEYGSEIDNSLHVIDKERYSFLSGDLFYKLDIFDFDTTKALLSVQVTHENQEVDVPEFVKVIKDVSDILNYKNYYLAKSQKY